jgi:hypothetical protein
MAVRLSALPIGNALPQRNIIFLLSKPQGLVLLEGLGKLKKKKIIHFIGSRTRDLSGCSIAP